MNRDKHKVKDGPETSGLLSDCSYQFDREVKKLFASAVHKAAGNRSDCRHAGMMARDKIPATNSRAMYLPHSTLGGLSAGDLGSPGDVCVSGG